MSSAAAVPAAASPAAAPPRASTSSSVLPAWLQGVWRAYLRCLSEQPVLTKSLSAGAISLLGDAVAQLLIERQGSRYALTRTAKFTSFGVVLAPCIHAWYKLCDRVFAGWPVLVRLAVDQLLFAPLINVFFFAYMSVVNADASNMRRNIARNLLPTLMMSWRVWPAFQLINFTYVPAHLRVLFGNLVSFGWNIFLSLRVNKRK